MNQNRLPDYLSHMRQDAEDTCSFVEGLSIAHGYLEHDLDVVWGTVQKALPELLRQLPIDVHCVASSGRLLDLC